MAMDTSPYDLKKVIIRAIDAETKDIIEEEAKNAAVKVEKRIREMAGRVALQASNHYTMQDMKDHLIITVKTNS